MKHVDKMIGFTAENILALRRGDKTHTRRVMKVQPLGDVKSATLWKDGLWRIEHAPIKAHDLPAGNYVGIRVRCPYGAPGDILGVKEGYRIIHDIPRSRVVTGEYLADDAEFEVELSLAEWDRWSARKFPYRATPGRFMYKSLCRDRLLVKGIRIERVQDITEDGAIAEGVRSERCFLYGEYDLTPTLRETKLSLSIWRFRHLWDSINAKRGYGWDVNPWVWVVEFERIET